MAVWSPRLSPDRCRIVYLENNVFGPHQQCSRLRMVSSPRGHQWDTRGRWQGGSCQGGSWQEGGGALSLACSKGGQAETLQNSSRPTSPTVRLVHQENQHSAGGRAAADMG